MSRMVPLPSGIRKIVNSRRALLVLRVLWALPCSAIGAILGVVVICLGGSARLCGPTVEIALADGHAAVPRWARSFRYSAITLGHVIVGRSHEILAALRAHERIHVQQYEALGPLFLVAYPAASLIAWLQGNGPYHGNYFEKQAIARSSHHKVAA
jgi:hypothetical protein